MAQMEAHSQAVHQTERRLFYRPNIDGRLIILCLISFFISRTVLFDVIAPFGFAFYAANYKKPFHTILIGIFAVLGMLTVTEATIQPGKYIIAMILFTMIQAYLHRMGKKRMPALAATASLFFTGLVAIAESGFVPYDFVMLLIEIGACFALLLVMERAIRLIESRSKRHVVTTEEAVSICVILSLCVVGFSHITLPWSISLRSTICALFILVFALSGGLFVGSAMGIGCGIISSIGQFPLAGTMGIYGLCGLMAGLLKKFGKSGVMLGFIITNLLLSFYAGGWNEGIFTVWEQVFALLLFWLIPKEATTHISDLIASTFPEPAYSTKMKDVVSEKLQKASFSFEQLAEALHKLTNWRQAGKNADVSVVFDEAANRVCKKCVNRFRCWQREFNTTYNALMHVIPVIEEYGSIEVAHLPEYFANRCIKVKEYVAEVNKQYDNYRVESVWQQKIDNSREMVTDQLYGVSKIIGNLSKELTAQIHFDPLLEAELMKELQERDVYPKEITVIKNAQTRYEINISLSPCGGEGICNDIIAPSASKIVGNTMCKKNEECAYKEKKKRCCIRLSQQEPLLIECAAARQAKEGQRVSGDNFSNMPVSGGRYIMAISDGMGSGREAASQSNTTVELLEKFLDAGFDKATAIKLINSVLLLRSTDETFATIDITMIDLFSGNAEFIKIGANTSYLKRGNKTERIISTSLPAGILGEVDIETAKKTLHGNDYIIMLSDGAENIQDLWVEAYLKTIKDTTPDSLAKQLIRKAIERSGGKDDITVLVGKIVERETYSQTEALHYAN